MPSSNGATVVGDDVIASTGYMKKQPKRVIVASLTFILHIVLKHLYQIIQRPEYILETT